MTQPPNQQPGWWQQQQPPGVPPQFQPGYPQQPPPQPGYQQAQGQPAFGGGFQPQYGGLGAFDSGQRPKRSKKPFIAGGVGIVVLAGAGIAAWLLGLFGGVVLDQQALESEVARVLQESYGERDVTKPDCPADQPVRNGHTFDCSVLIAGQPKAVTIRVLNDKPEFEVGAPHEPQ